MHPARNLLLLVFLVAMVAPSGIRGQSKSLPLCYAASGIPPESCVSFFPSPDRDFEYPKYTLQSLVGTRGGNIELSVVISESGVAQDIRVVKSLGKDLDEATIAALRQTKFNPGTYKGQAVSTRGTAVLHVSCLAYMATGPTPETSDYTPAEDAKKHSQWKGPLTDCGQDPKLLRRGVCAPMLVNRTTVTIEKDSKLAEMSGTVILSVKIDEQGFVRDIHIVTSAEEKLNEQATALLHEWRFRAALYKGQPFIVRARLRLRFWSCADHMYWDLVP